MIYSFILKPAVCSLAVAVALSACSTGPNTADARSRPNGPAAVNAGRIPTQDSRGAHYQPGGVVGGANGPEYAVRTGSQLPTNQNRRAHTTDAPEDNFVYDQNDIRLQSTNSVGDSLRSVPGVNVQGSR